MSKHTKKQEDKILDELKKSMHQFTLKNYGVPLNIPVTWSGRLKVRWGYFSIIRYKRDGMYRGKIVKKGQYDWNSMKIVLSKKLLDSKNKNLILSIAKHEALHYALCVKGKPFYDGNPYFERELRKHGLVSTSVSTKDLGIKDKYWVWVCSDCSKIIIKGGKTRKDYSRGYVSKCCRKPLVEKGWQIIKHDQTHLK